MLAIPQINLDIRLLHSDRTGQLLLMIGFFLMLKNIIGFKTVSNASYGTEKK